MTARTARGAPIGRDGVRRESGYLTLELLGMVPLLFLGLFALLQLTLAAVTVQSTSTAARAAARAVSLNNGDPDAAARAAVPGWLADRLSVEVGSTTSPGVVVRTSVPVLLPGVAAPVVSRAAWFDAGTAPAPWH